jgi:hypothetical protein
LNDLRSPWPKKQEMTTNEYEEEEYDEREEKKGSVREETSLDVVVVPFLHFLLFIF